MNGIEVIETMTDSNSSKLFHMSGVLADPETRKIMKHLALPTCIHTDSIPDSLDISKSHIISRLITLEKIGITNSEKEKTKNGFCKKYWLSEKGSNLTNKLIK